MEAITKVRLRVDMRHLPLIGEGNLKEAIVEKEATLTSTWRNFLSTEVGLNLPTSKKTYGQQGWSANLNDKIEDFVARYKRTLPMYSIRLLPGNGGGVTSAPIALVPSQPQRPPSQRPGKTYRVPPPPPAPPAPIRARPVRRRQRSASARGRPYQRGGQGQAFGGGGGDVPPVLAREKTPSSVRGAPSAGGGGGGNPQMESFLQGLFPPGAIRERRTPFGGNQQQQPRNMEVDDDESSDEDDDGADGGIQYDNLSDGTAPADEEIELRNEGIPMDFIKAEAVQRLSRMDNSILLKARKEVDTLRQDHRWAKNVKRSPFCCFVIEDLLRPPQRN